MGRTFLNTICTADVLLNDYRSSFVYENGCWKWAISKKKCIIKKECTVSSWIRLREFLFQTATFKWNYWQSNTEREFYDWIGYFSLNVTKEIKLVKILWKLTSLNVTCRSPSFASIKSFIQFKNDLAGFHPNLYRRFGIKLKYPQLWP